MSRRLVPVVAVVALLAACSVTVTSDRDRREEPITATAYSKVDDVESWDLTADPSDTAFGIEQSLSAGIYETDEPRRVRTTPR